MTTPFGHDLDQQTAPEFEPLTPDHMPVDAEKMHESTEREEEAYFEKTYMWQMGKPDKAREGGRKKGALPCDDAMAATATDLVLCDGVSQGGATSLYTTVTH